MLPNVADTALPGPTLQAASLATGVAAIGMDDGINASVSRWRARFGLHEPDPARPIDALTRARVHDEQIRLVWAHSRVGTLVATLFAVVLAMQLRGHVASNLVVDSWLIAKLAVGGYRSYLAWQHARLGQPGGPHWRRLTMFWLLADGALWGCLGIAMLQTPVALTAVLLAAIAGVSCAATFGLQISLRATAAYVVPTLLPAALLLPLRDDKVGWSGWLGVLMLLGLQLGNAARSDRRLRDALRLSWRNEALASEKDAALQLAQRQSAVKTQFLANISHELRTPLHGILGLARVLRFESLDSRVARRVELIESSGLHLLALINDLLDISRVEAGRFVMRSESFDLVTQIDQVAGVYAVRAQETQLGFELVHAVPSPCRVVGDPARFRQVLHNLLGNAVKFTEQGVVRLTVAYRRDEGIVHCTVEDSGRGIAASDLPHIFDAFRQSEASPASQPLDGAGLGLTIARDIAQAMGGDITVQSRIGIGSTFRFEARLPAAPSVAERPRPAPPPASPGGQRVLLAEDDDVNAMIAIAYLERMGLAIERVANGADAIEASLRLGDRPDLVLMDCRMPVMDGFAAVRAIRSQEAALGLSRVPVIALTATAADTERQLCLDAGMDDFLAKPYSAAELSRMAAHWLAANSEAPARESSLSPDAVFATGANPT